MRNRDIILRCLILLLILIAFAWRVHTLTVQSLWRDEVDAIYFALRPLPQTLDMFVQAGQNGPLYFLSLRPWFYLMGTSEFAVRFPAAMAGILSIPLLWQVARKLLGTAGGSYLPLLAAVLLAFNPYQLWYSQEAKMYTTIIFLAQLSSWYWLKGIETPIAAHKNSTPQVDGTDHNGQGGATRGSTVYIWLAYFLVTTISIYIHLLMILIIPLHFIWFVIAWPQSRHHWCGYAGALAGLTLPYLPMVWWQWHLLTSSERLTGFNFTPLDQVLRVLLLNHSRGFMPPAELYWLVPIFFLGLTGLLMGVAEFTIAPTQANAFPTTLNRLSTTLVGWRRYLLLLSWLIGPILFIHLLSLRQPIFVDRYVIWIAPAAMLFVALGVRVVQQNAAALSRPLAIGLTIYVLGFWLYAGWQQKNTDIKYDLRSAVSYITERRAAEELLILQIPHMEYSYRYYSSDMGPTPFVGSDERLGHWAGGLWTNNGFDDEKAQAEVDATMSAMTAAFNHVWVLSSEVEMWDRRHLMAQWLDGHGVVTEQVEFHGSQVRKYELTR